MRQSQDETWSYETRAKTRHERVETEPRQRRVNVCLEMSRDETRVSRRDMCLETRSLVIINFLVLLPVVTEPFFRLLPYSLSSAHPLYITVHSFFSHVQLALSTNPSYRRRLYPPDWLSCAIEHFQIYIRRFNIVRAIPRYEDLDCVKWDISGAWQQFWVRTSFLTPPLTHTVSAGT